MATQTASLISSTASAAAQQAFGAAISSALSAFGWTQSSDTGQANFSTLAYQTPGYQIWTMADSLQATAPCYLGIYLNASAQYLVSIGTGSTGSGALTGAANNLPLASGFPLAAATASSSALPCYFSGASNRVSMLFLSSPTAQTYGSLFSVERAHDASGNDLASYISLAALTSSYPGLATVSLAQYATGFAPGGAASSLSYPFEQYGISFQTAASSAGGALAPVYPNLDAVGIGNPFLNLVLGKAADYAEAVQAAATHYGSTHYYIFTQSPPGAAKIGGLYTASYTSNALGMRFE